MRFGEISLLGALLIGFIILIRMFFKSRISRRVLVCFWCLILVRLLLPFSLALPSAASAWTERLPIPMLHSIVSDAADQVVSETGTNVQIGWDTEVAIQAISNAKAVSPLHIMQAVWLLGAAGLFIFFVGNHMWWCRKYREAVPLEHPHITEWIMQTGRSRRFRIRQSDQIHSPMIYGVFRPTILLPKWMDPNEKERLHFVLTHEWVHIQHFDLWKKMAMLAAVSLHWFNPLVWMMLHLLERDIELACDDRVIAIHGHEARSGYAYALIGMEEERGSFLPVRAYFSHTILEKRIKEVMNLRKHSVFVTAFVILLFAGLCLWSGFSVHATEALAGEMPITRQDPEINVFMQTQYQTGFTWTAYIDQTPIAFMDICIDENQMLERIRQCQNQCDIYTSLGIYMDTESGMLSYQGRPVRYLLDHWKPFLSQPEVYGSVSVTTVYQGDEIIGLELSEMDM